MIFLHLHHVDYYDPPHLLGEPKPKSVQTKGRDMIIRAFWVASVTKRDNEDEHCLVTVFSGDCFHVWESLQEVTELLEQVRE